MLTYQKEQKLLIKWQCSTKGKEAKSDFSLGLEDLVKARKLTVQMQKNGSISGYDAKRTRIRGTKIAGRPFWYELPFERWDRECEKQKGEYEVMTKWTSSRTTRIWPGRLLITFLLICLQYWMNAFTFQENTVWNVKISHYIFNWMLRAFNIYGYSKSRPWNNMSQFKRWQSILSRGCEFSNLTKHFY